MEEKRDIYLKKILSYEGSEMSYYARILDSTDEEEMDELFLEWETMIMNVNANYEQN